MHPDPLQLSPLFKATALSRATNQSKPIRGPLRGPRNLLAGSCACSSLFVWCCDFSLLIFPNWEVQVREVIFLSLSQSPNFSLSHLPPSVYHDTTRFRSISDTVSTVSEMFSLPAAPTWLPSCLLIVMHLPRNGMTSVPRSCCACSRGMRVSWPGPWANWPFSAVP